MPDGELGNRREGVVHRVARSAVKKHYQKTDGVWVAKLGRRTARLSETP